MIIAIVIFELIVCFLAAVVIGLGNQGSDQALFPLQVWLAAERGEQPLGAGGRYARFAEMVQPRDFAELFAVESRQRDILLATLIVCVDEGDAA